ncbi:MAG: hypothetical protein KBC46_03335 [Ferrovibrio sp.]|nr:hypothetical protein [Ferrovibrio sp.]
MTLRITSESGHGVTLKFLGPNGEDITKMLAVAYGGTVHLDTMISASLDLLIDRVDIAAEDVRWCTKNPTTGTFDEIASIDFRDGTRVELGRDGSVRCSHVTPPTGEAAA